MSRDRMAVRIGLVAAIVVSVVAGVAIQPAGAAPVRTGPVTVSTASDGTTVSKTVIRANAGEEYLAQQTVSVVAAAAPAAAPQAPCPAPPPGSSAMVPACEPPIRCRTLDSTYVIYVIPTYQELVRWRVQYTWCWQGSSVTSARPTPTTPNILSGTIRVSGEISRTNSSLPGYGGVNVYTEGLQFEVIVLGFSVKAFNPKLRFYLTSTGQAYNLSILA